MSASRPRPAPNTAIVAGTLAGLIWGLAFLIPVLLDAWSQVAVTIGRYLAYGGISLILVPAGGRAMRSVIRRHWGTAVQFALTGNGLLPAIGARNRLGERPGDRHHHRVHPDRHGRHRQHDLAELPVAPARPAGSAMGLGHFRVCSVTGPLVSSRDGSFTACVTSVRVDPRGAIKDHSDDGQTIC